MLIGRNAGLRRGEALGLVAPGEDYSWAARGPTGRLTWSCQISTKAPGPQPEPPRPKSDTESAVAATADPSGLSSLLGILRIRPFRRLWVVLGVASLGDWLGLLATALFAQAQV